MREMLERWHWIMREQFGISPKLTLRALMRSPQYVVQLCKFSSIYSGRLEIRPCLHDRGAEAGAVRGEYFWQDLYVAQKIFKASPRKHVDVGSRINGFVAHVASFREIEVID